MAREINMTYSFMRGQFGGNCGLLTIIFLPLQVKSHTRELKPWHRNKKVIIVSTLSLIQKSSHPQPTFPKMHIQPHLLSSIPIDLEICFSIILLLNACSTLNTFYFHISPVPPCHFHLIELTFLFLKFLFSPFIWIKVLFQSKGQSHLSK